MPTNVKRAPTLTISLGSVINRGTAKRPIYRLVLPSCKLGSAMVYSESCKLRHQKRIAELNKRRLDILNREKRSLNSGISAIDNAIDTLKKQRLLNRRRKRDVAIAIHTIKYPDAAERDAIANGEKKVGWYTDSNDHGVRTQRNEWIEVVEEEQNEYDEAKYEEPTTPSCDPQESSVSPPSDIEPQRIIGRVKGYTAAALAKAVDSVASGRLTHRQASITYRVPRSTIYGRLPVGPILSFDPPYSPPPLPPTSPPPTPSPPPPPASPPPPSPPPSPSLLILPPTIKQEDS